MTDDAPTGPSADPRAVEREREARIRLLGSREDRPCPRCGKLGYRRVADSEMVALHACRFCGYQAEVVHDPQPQVDPPFREYREGRGLQSAVDESRDEADRST